jgi:phenylpyruvate tautomerase PptA (4-oxalocrotonate tautomerase family)
MGSKNAEWSRNMPLYECVTTAGTLNEDQREQIADAITQAHCELTGAPVELVHVIFSDIPRGNSYSGGKRATPTVIRGNIRAGRSDEVRHTLMKRISDAYIDATGVDPKTVLVAVADFPPSWGMEGGLIMPDVTPESEEAWLNELRSL